MKTKRFFFQLAILVLLFSLIVFIGWCGYCLLQYSNALGAIIVGFSIIVGGWVFLSALHSLTKHSWTVILFFMLLCGWGIVVYQPTAPAANGNVFIGKIVEPLNKALSVFFPSRGSFDDPSDYANHSSYHLLHLSAYFFFALFFFSIFGRRLINSSRRFLALRANKNIFWSDSHGGRLLAKDILNAKMWQQTVFVLSHNVKDETDKEKALFEKIDSMGGIVLYRDFDTIRRYPQGLRHFFLTEDQDFNLKMALQIAKLSQPKKEKIQIYLRNEMPRIDYLFRNMKHVELHILNQSGIVARQFIEAYPLIDLVPDEQINRLTVDFDFNVLILGFGWQGRELLNKTICDAQFKGSKFSVTVIDRDIDLKNGEYQLLFDECIREYNISFVENEEIRNIGSKTFYRWFKDNFQRFKRIIVALGDDKQNINFSLAMANIMIAAGETNPQKKLFANVAYADKYSYSEYPVTMFGLLDAIYTYDIIVAEILDKIAKAVNYIYWNYHDVDLKTIDWAKAEDNWSAISRNSNSTFNKNSSRAVAMNVKNIITLTGGRAGFDKTIENPELLEILSENEHLRWNAFHFTEGITVWDEISDDNPNDAKLFRYPQEKVWLIKHACLVKYDELDRISDRINEIRVKLGTIEKKGEEDYKKVDRMIVSHFGLFYDIFSQK